LNIIDQFIESRIWSVSVEDVVVFAIATFWLADPAEYGVYALAF